jgi:hypothetical protein
MRNVATQSFPAVFEHSADAGFYGRRLRRHRDCPFEATTPALVPIHKPPPALPRRSRSREGSADRPVPENSAAGHPG